MSRVPEAAAAAPAGALDARGLPPIYLCGPIAMPGEPARGGYQACNRRTIAALRDAGADVRPLPYPHPRSRGWRKVVAYAAGFLRLFARVLRCPRGAVVHLTALSLGFTYLQWVLVRLACWRGCAVVFDLRAGAGLVIYRRAGVLYRLAFDTTARAAAICLVEGEELVPFVSERSGRPAAHFPNHIDTARVPVRGPTPASPVVAYAGRIVAEKGIEVALDACRALAADGIAPRVCVAGEGDPGYLDELQRRYADLDVEWLGPVSSDRVLALFAAAQFFVFPTRHFGEGQSNALTEALACGCVPVVSRHGFNASVVGPAGMVLDPDAGAEDYARCMADLWRDGARWRTLSEAGRQRANALFSTPAAVSRLIGHYRSAAANLLPARPPVL